MISVLQHMSLSLIKLPVMTVSPSGLKWLLMGQSQRLDPTAQRKLLSAQGPRVSCGWKRSSFSALLTAQLEAQLVPDKPQSVPRTGSVWVPLGCLPVLPALPARQGRAGIQVRSNPNSAHITDLLKPKSWLFSAAEWTGFIGLVVLLFQRAVWQVWAAASFLLGKAPTHAERCADVAWKTSPLAEWLRDRDFPKLFQKQTHFF